MEETPKKGINALLSESKPRPARLAIYRRARKDLPGIRPAGASRSLTARTVRAHFYGDRPVPDNLAAFYAAYFGLCEAKIRDIGKSL